MLLDAMSAANPLYGPIAGGTRVCINGQFLYGFKATAAHFGPHGGSVDEPKRLYYFPSSDYYFITYSSESLN